MTDLLLLRLRENTTTAEARRLSSTGVRGLHVPRLGKERLVNKAHSLRFVRQYTTIPVPAVYYDFEDDEAYYLITKYVEGMEMDLPRFWM
jgi:aminoglycoside phosphotransferase